MGVIMETRSPIKKPPAATRNRSKPTPGLPLGNVEYKRCKRNASSNNATRLSFRDHDQIGYPRPCSFEGYALYLGDPALDSKLDRMRPIARAHFGKNALYMSFNRMFRDR